jgi:hypothetical protein
MVNFYAVMVPVHPILGDPLAFHLLLLVHPPQHTYVWTINAIIPLHHVTILIPYLAAGQTALFAQQVIIIVKMEHVSRIKQIVGLLLVQPDWQHNVPADCVWQTIHHVRQQPVVQVERLTDVPMEFVCLLLDPVLPLQPAPTKVIHYVLMDPVLPL